MALAPSILRLNIVAALDWEDWRVGNAKVALLISCGWVSHKSKFSCSWNNNGGGGRRLRLTVSETSEDGTDV